MLFTSYLNKPHPFIFNKSSVLIPFIITFLIIALFQPFELAEYEKPDLILWALLFGSIASGSVILNINVGKYLFPNYMNDESWTIGKELLLIFSVLTTIILSIYFLFLLLIPNASAIELAQMVIVRTLAISLFPIIFIVLFEQYQHQKIKWKEAAELNQQLAKSKTDNLIPSKQSENLISILAENETVALQIHPDQLVYAKSDGNYVECFYLEENEIKKELIRLSMKSLELQLPSEQFYRCHKSYIIQIKLIEQVNGNARNLELELRHINKSIPVSRSKTKEIGQFLVS